MKKDTHWIESAEALRRLVEVTFDHHAAHPEFVRLVSVENIHDARVVTASPTIRARNAAVIGTLRDLIALPDGTCQKWGGEFLDWTYRRISSGNVQTLGNACGSWNDERYVHLSKGKEEAAAQAFFVVRSPKPQPHAHAD